jgi:hypothetical protein
MSAQFQVVVSSENSLYMAWQTQLFCISCMTRLGQHPIVVVHAEDDVLRPEFIHLQKVGCEVIIAPSFKKHKLGNYPPRNELGTLLTICDHPLTTDFILLCEPDMLFVTTLDYPDELCGEYYSYVQYHDERIMHAAKALGLAAETENLERQYRIGVPYLIPVRLLSRIAPRWLSVLDSFPCLEWTDIMPAYGLALAVEKLTATTTRITTNNSNVTARLSGALIHYCHRDAIWSKQLYAKKSPLVVNEAELPTGRPGSILFEMMQQLRQARGFFRQTSPPAGPSQIVRTPGK